MAAIDHPTDLREYPLVVEFPVQWGEQDAFGHVNHAVPLRWFESARVAYLERSGLGHLMKGESLAPIIASVTCDYRRQLHYPDVVQIGVRVASMSRSSMVMQHAVLSTCQKEMAVHGTAVVVFFDYQAHRPRRIPRDVRTAIEAFEQRTVAGEPPPSYSPMTLTRTRLGRRPSNSP